MKLRNPLYFQTFCNYPNNSSIPSIYRNSIGKLLIHSELHFAKLSSRWRDIPLALRMKLFVDFGLFSVWCSIEPFEWSLDIIVCSLGTFISKTSNGNVCISEKFLFRVLLWKYQLNQLILFFSRWQRFRYWRNTRIGTQSTRTNRNDQQNLVNEEPNVEVQPEHIT